MIAGLVLLAGGAAAGVFGSLLGLGGGVLIVPLLTLGFGRPLREAVAVSLVSVIVTSSASAGVYLQRHVANLRLGMVLELFTASGALVGGLVAFLLAERVLAGLFAALLTWVAVSMTRRGDTTRTPVPVPADAGDRAAVTAAPVPQAAGLPAPVVAVSAAGAQDSLAASLSGPGYLVDRLRLGMAGSVFAGVISALLGVGGGIVKVPVMHLMMGVPLKVATATSNMMIGITATSSAVIYLLRGEIDPYVAGPTALGVFLGASIGSRIAHRVDVRLLRWLFVAVLVYTAFEMARKALGL
ncbi:MAG: sulfite exporter TauE/SafE family protein [Candidatus Limnocylindrales bacterium]